METHPIIDLHMHSAVSDGTDSPEELLSHVRATGIGCFSLTDHDAIAGCKQIRSLLRPGDPRFLFGVEFSCRDVHGRYHILGYGYDPNAESVLFLVETAHTKRMRKLDTRLRMLKEQYGYAFADADIAALHACSNPGKPHIANMMIRYGYADTIRQAFSDCLNRLHVPGDYIRPESAIAGILDAGGIPVLAHPCFGDGNQLVLGASLKKRVARLVGFGLKGLECFYSGFSEAHQAETLSIAEQFDLYITAGSDYHGKNKAISLANTGLTAEMPLPDGFRRFLRDVRSLSE